MHARSHMNRKTLRLLSFVALLALAAPSLFAADFGVRAGRSNDLDEEFIGVDLLIDLGRVNFNPNVEYFLLDEDAFGDTSAATVNADFTVDFGSSAFQPYVGLGVGLFWVDNDFIDNETETLANAIGGIQWNLEFLKPYAQVKYSRSLDNNDGDNDDLAFVIGLRF